MVLVRPLKRVVERAKHAAIGIAARRTSSLLKGLLLAVLIMLPFARPEFARAQAGSPVSATQIGLPGVKPWFGDFEAMRKRRILRVLVPYSRTLFFVDRGRQQGVAAEIGRRFEDWLNKRYRTGKFRIQVVFVPTRRDAILSALTSGLGDVAAANLTVTPEREAQVSFAPAWSDRIAEIVVTGPASPAVSTLDDLAGRVVHVRASSSYASHLASLNAVLVAKAREPLRIEALDERLEDEDVLEMVQAGLLPLAVVDSHKAQIWAGILGKLTPRPDLAIASDQSIAWAFRRNSPELAAVLAAFVAEHRMGTAFGNDIIRRYFKDDRLLKNARSAQAMQRFGELEAAFREQGRAHGFDALMLTAQGFQESQLDQSRRSHRGAVGVMQLLPSTAADKAVGISGIESDAAKNIEAGAIYLRHLIRTYIGDAALPDSERMLFAFAAYNAGPGNLRKFRTKARQIGLDPDRWFDNVEHGAAMTVGRETVDYVANIYKYYVAYKLAQPAKISSEDGGALAPVGSQVRP